MAEGLPRTPRILDLLDIAACTRLNSQGGSRHGHTGSRFGSFFVDTSQSHSRRCWTGAEGQNRTFTTSTELYHFGHDRIVLPWEMLLMLGFPGNVRVPRDLNPRDLKTMIGNSMSLPSVGTLLWSLHVMRYREFEVGGLGPRAHRDL